MVRNRTATDRAFGRREFLAAGLAGLTAASGGCVAPLLVSDDSSPPGVFHALSLADGSTAWTTTVDNAVQSAAAVAGETVYIGADDGFLRALSTSDGTEKWNFDTVDPAFANHPDYADFAFVTTDVALGDGGVYAGTDQANVVGVDAETGEQRWRISLESPYTNQMITTIRSTPAVADGVLAFGTSNDQELVYGVDARSGGGRWEFETGGRVNGGPAGVADRFYVVDTVGNVAALSSDGDTRWETTVTGLTGGSPTASDGTVFLGSDQGVHALDAETGDELWVTRETSHWVDSRPTAAGELVFAVSRSGTVAAFDRGGGTERWSVDVGAHASTSPAVADGRVVAGDRDGRIVALDAADGSELWVKDTEEAVTATPVVAGGTVYVGTK